MNKKPFSKIVLVAAAVFLLAAGCNYSPDKQPAIQELAEIKVSQSVEGGKNLEVFSLKAGEKKTALDILKDSYQVQTKSFGDAGEFVESINEVKPDSKHFWSFYVNGKQSNVGAGSYEVQNGDSLEWKLEEIK